MATTFDYTYDATNSNASANTSERWGRNPINISKIHIDMSVAAAALGTIDGSASDVLQIWDIPYPCWIMGCWVKVTTAEGATATVAVGTGDSAAGFMAAGSINSEGWLIPAITDAYMATNGIFYSAAETLDLTFGTDTDIDTAVFDVYVAWMSCDQ